MTQEVIIINVERFESRDKKKVAVYYITPEAEGLRKSIMDAAVYDSFSVSPEQTFATCSQKVVVSEMGFQPSGIDSIKPTKKGILLKW